LPVVQFHPILGLPYGGVQNPWAWGYSQLSLVGSSLKQSSYGESPIFHHFSIFGGIGDRPLIWVFFLQTLDYGYGKSFPRSWWIDQWEILRNRRFKKYRKMKELLIIWACSSSIFKHWRPWIHHQK
jgi:hypothetical protein